MSAQVNNEVRNAYGKIIGFRCFVCSKVAPSMWGDTCNECRENERRHEELVAALSARGTEK